MRKNPGTNNENGSVKSPHVAVTVRVVTCLGTIVGDSGKWQHAKRDTLGIRERDQYA